MKRVWAAITAALLGVTAAAVVATPGQAAPPVAPPAYVVTTPNASYAPGTAPVGVADSQGGILMAALASCPTYYACFYEHSDYSGAWSYWVPGSNNNTCKTLPSAYWGASSVRNEFGRGLKIYGSGSPCGGKLVALLAAWASQSCYWLTNPSCNDTMRYFHWY